MKSKKTEALAKPEPSQGRKISRFFWGTILFLAGGTVALVVVGYFRSSPPQAPIPNTEHIVTATEIQPTKFEEFFSKAARAAEKTVTLKIDPMLETVYAPVYAAIPAYADFHYSVLGEYTELSEAALGTMSEALYTRLYNGFEQRLDNAVSSLDREYSDAYVQSLKNDVKKELGPNASQISLGPITQKILKAAIDRAKITAPLATVAAGVVGSGALKKLTLVMAKKLAGKIVAKATAKGVVKGGGILAGATGGATLCSWTGPGAAVCGIAGGLAAWLVTDAAIVNLDEYFNRTEFENDLRKMIDEHKAQTKQRLMAALKRKAQQMDEVGKSLTGEFTLRELPTVTSGTPSRPKSRAPSADHSPNH